MNKLSLSRQLSFLWVALLVGGVTSGAEAALVASSDPIGVARGGMRLSPLSPSACVDGNILCGSSRSGQLATDDCILPNKEYIDYYTFQGTAGYTVTIDMTASSIDTFLLLFDPSGAYVASNDDTNTSNSRLTYRLTRSGTWRIGATSARAYEIGNYSLSLLCVDLGSPNLTPYRPSAWSDAVVVSTVSGATSDSANITAGTSVYLRWAVLNVGLAAVEPGTTVYVDVFVDNVFRVRGSVDQDWPGGVGFLWNSYNIGSLQAGTHSVRIRADATGVVQESNEADNEYTRAFQVQAPPPSPPTANFTFNPASPTLNQSVQFSDTSSGNPTSWVWDFGDGATSLERNPVHIYTVVGSYTVRLTATNAGGSGNTTRQFFVALPPLCFATTIRLCLNNERFGVQVAWSAVGRGGGSGTATAIRLTGDTGYFWFFSPNNVELVVKVVDGRAFNGRYWVFYGAMSDVEYTITVTDSFTGRVKSYFNPSGTLGSVADTAAFLPGAASSEAFEAEVSQGRAASSEIPNVETPSATCAATPFSLCLNGGRFAVDVAYASALSSGPGNAISLTTDTGYFWFFSPSNLELVIKVVDGHAVNGHFWVFYGALSDVEYTITVTDLQTGAVKRYTNPPGRLASTADVAAFP